MGSTPRRKKKNPVVPPGAPSVVDFAPTESTAAVAVVDAPAPPTAPATASEDKPARKAARKPRKKKAPANDIFVEHAAPAEPRPPAEDVVAEAVDPVEAEQDRQYADALANAFIAFAPEDDEVRPEPEPWVDLVLESAPTRTSPANDATGEVTKLPLLPRSARPVVASVTSEVAKPAPRAGASRPVTSRNTAVETRPAPATTTRWWLVLPVFVALAVALFMNRPGKRHAPVPVGVLGQWTTAFWLYENQTLEIKADTVVLTLDDPEEGRYPITKVETASAGPETNVKISYRSRSGDEKELDFLADTDPTTALRFRAHSGLVWVRVPE